MHVTIDSRGDFSVRYGCCARDYFRRVSK